MAANSTEIARDLIVAWIGSWRATMPEPKEVAEAFRTVHKAVLEAERVGSK